MANSETGEREAGAPTNGEREAYTGIYTRVYLRVRRGIYHPGIPSG